MVCTSVLILSEKCCFIVHSTEVKRELSKDQEEVAKWFVVFMCVTFVHTVCMF